MSEVGREASGCHLIQLLWSSRDSYSRVPRVMSTWLLNISKRDTLHPSRANCASAWSSSQEKNVSCCSKSEVMRPLLCSSSTLCFCHRLPAWDDSGAFFSFSWLDLCIHLSLVLSFSAAGDCFVTEDLHLSLLEGVVFLAWCCHVPIPLGWIMFCTLTVGEKHCDAPCSKQELFLKA